MSHIHLIGIGGAGLSAIATVLIQQGRPVSGSDMQANENTARLRDMGATVHLGHRAENLPAGTEAVVISSAIPGDNPERLAAQQRGLPVLKRDEWLGTMLADYHTLAVAGTHGKTTTTAMLAFVLSRANYDPGYIIGGYVPQLGSNAAAGQSDLFVIEADEYDYMFLGLNPATSIITNVEWDHPDLFPTEAALREAFARFIGCLQPDSLLLACGDDPGARAVVAGSAVRLNTYGLHPASDWRAEHVRPNARGGYDFWVQGVPVSLQVPGQHNVYNGLAVLAACEQVGLSLCEAAPLLNQFQGVGRRFELKGEVNGMTLIDDYAHHPTAVQTTLAGARARFGERPLWVVFQPHTFSRTAALHHLLDDAFTAADHVIVLDIYAARERDPGTIHSREVVARLNHPDARYLGTLAEAAAFLGDHLQPGDVLITMGAGTSYQLGDMVLQSLEQRA